MNSLNFFLIPSSSPLTKLFSRLPKLLRFRSEVSPFIGLGYLCDSVVEPWPNNFGPKRADRNSDHQTLFGKKTTHQHNKGCGSKGLLHARHVAPASEPSHLYFVFAAKSIQCLSLFYIRNKNLSHMDSSRLRSSYRIYNFCLTNINLVVTLLRYLILDRKY